MIAALNSEMKCQGQSSRPAFPYSWWPERKCNSGTKCRAGEVKCDATMQFPQLNIGLFAYGKPHLKQTEPLTPTRFCISSPTYYALVPAFLPRLSSNATFSVNFSASLAKSSTSLPLAPRGLHLFLHAAQDVSFYTILQLLPLLSQRVLEPGPVLPHSRNSKYLLRE